MVMMIVLNAREENEVTIKEPVHLEAMTVYWKSETIFYIQEIIGFWNWDCI